MEVAVVEQVDQLFGSLVQTGAFVGLDQAQKATQLPLAGADRVLDAGIQRQAVEQGVTRPAQQGVDEREGAHGEGFIRRRRAEVQGKALAHGGTGQQLRQHQQAGRAVACQQQGKDQPLQALQTEGGDGPTDAGNRVGAMVGGRVDLPEQGDAELRVLHQQGFELAEVRIVPVQMIEQLNLRRLVALAADRKSTRLNSSHVRISYAVFCLKKKK